MKIIARRLAAGGYLSFPIISADAEAFPGSFR
jgi:hypothetical protein